MSNLNPQSLFWFLDEFSDKGIIREYKIRSFPYTIGRSSKCSLTLPSESVSKYHARIEVDENRLRIIDLGSTNGTHINGQRLTTSARISDGDIVHIGNLQFRLRGASVDADIDAASDSLSLTIQKANPWVAETHLLYNLLRGEGVDAYYQPIVSLADNTIHGFEVLGRANVNGLPQSPKELFHIASRLGVECELSQLFWTYGIRLGEAMPHRPFLFVNIHPLELANFRVLDSLKKMQTSLPNGRIVLEIHEAAVIDLIMIRWLKDELASLGIGLAYDDFGVGESRLNELAEVPPDYLKLDRSLIENLHQASQSKQLLVESLVRIVHQLGVIALAEGIESAEQAETCRKLGLDLAQGHYYAEPRPISHWLSKRL
jgi:EAL domain-containing protein (putative c-di-GMP-specific phosphodiesterase class I)